MKIVVPSLLWSSSHQSTHLYPSFEQHIKNRTVVPLAKMIFFVFREHMRKRAITRTLHLYLCENRASVCHEDYMLSSRALGDLRPVSPFVEKIDAFEVVEEQLRTHATMRSILSNICNRNETEAPEDESTDECNL
jgi:hypothetical protein